MAGKVCYVTGHGKIPADKLDYVKSELREEITRAVADGYTHFISGFAEGAELLFASVVAELMQDNAALTLEAAIPYRKRLQTTSGLFDQLLDKCKAIGIYGEAYSPSCYIIRDRVMVSKSQRVIAVYDGWKKGNTLFTIRYARLQNRDVRVIEL